MCRKHFKFNSSLVLFWGWVAFFPFLSLKKTKKLSKKTLRDKNYQYSLLRTFKPMKKKYHRGTKRGSRLRKTIQASQDPPQSQLEPVFCTTDNTGSVINHFSSACAREARELRKASCRLLAKCEKGLGPPQAAALKGNAIWTGSFLCSSSHQQCRAADAPLSIQSQAPPHEQHSGEQSLLLLPSIILIKEEHTLFKFTSWVNRAQLTADALID